MNYQYTVITLKILPDVAIKASKAIHETILIIARSATHKKRYVSSAKWLKNHYIIVLTTSQLCCLEMDRGFSFLKKEAANFASLQKKH